MIGQTISHYKILQKLGQGGMAEVYLAEDTRLHRRVALKFLSSSLIGDEEIRTRFEREAQAAATLHHPNIVIIHELGEFEGRFYIVMEYVEGELLRELIDKRILSLQEALGIAIQICDGLSKAHQAGIVHRDIKPENIVISRDGWVKILDFGLAKLQGASKLTEEAYTVGTVDYMSPEQAQGESIDHRTDIWSLGVVLYEMITGKLPFYSESKMAVLYQIVNEEPHLLPLVEAGIPKEVELILKKAMQKNRERRYQSIDEFKADLRTLQKGSGSEGSIKLIAKVVSRKRKQFYFYPILMGMVALLMGGGFYFFRSEILNLGLQVLKVDLQTQGPVYLDRYRIAVLPFTSISPDPKDEYFADGITEELISTLSKIDDFRVIARTSVTPYKGSTKSIAEIGQELKVGTILEGSVRKAEDKLRITVQLIDVQSQSHLWSQEYDREFKEVFVIQSNIAQRVAEALKVQLLVGEKQQIEKQATESVEAYTWYLRGRYFQSRRTEEGLKTSIEYFERAIEKDPLYALACSGLADSYNLLAIYGYLSPREAYPKVKMAATTALEMDESLSEAHTSLAFTRHRFDWDWSGAEKEFKRAIQSNPSYASAYHWYSLLLRQMGRAEESFAAIKRAQELDPLSLVINTDLGTHFYYARQYDQAIAYHQKTLEMNPNFARVYIDLGTAYEQKGMYKEAIAAFQKGVLLSGGNSLIMASLGHAYAVSGRREEAQKILRELQDQTKQRYVLPYAIALIYMGLDEKDRTFEWLEKAYEERSGWLVFLNISPLFDPLRDDSRFGQLLKKIGLEK
jgi:serine/threonine-protein kinase